MVSGWAHGAERHVGVTVAEPIYGYETGTGRKPGRQPRTRTHHRVRIQPSTAGRIKVDEGLHVAGRMDPEEIHVGDRRGSPANQGVVQARCGDAVEHRCQAGRPFGMATTRNMVQEPFIGHQQDGHPASVSPSSRRLRAPAPTATGPTAARDAQQQRRTLFDINLRPPTQPARRGPLALRRAPAPGPGIHRVEYRRIGSGTTVRISPWRGDVSTAQVVTVGGPAPDEAMVLDLLQLLGRRGVTTVLTAALSPEDQCPFSAAGFTALEHLALMHRSLHPGDPAPPSRSSHRLRRIGRPRLADALDADAEAFSSFTPFWLFDGAAYTEACEATDLSRQRCVRSDGRITAYAITGRTSTNGFVQRLAVRPDHEGMGLGSALLVDALSWLALGGARDAWVNTQPDNDRARALYLRHGFEEKAGGLTVLRHVSAR